MSALIVVGLGFGDEGKGKIVDYLARTERDVTHVVRYNGGPQAGHRVVTDDGRSHVFSQFGSGTFVDGVQTHLSRFMLIDPLTMFNEEKHLRECGATDAFDRLSIDLRCLVITPFHVHAGRLRELSRHAGHGSCGLGVGEARRDWVNRRSSTLLAGHLNEPDLAERLVRIQQAKVEDVKDLARRVPASFFEREDWNSEVNELLDPSLQIAELVERYREIGKHVSDFTMPDSGSTVIFEGAQGVLLDELHGFHPHTTWTNTTTANAYSLIPESYRGSFTTIGVTRAYSTRHGAGPFPTHDETWELPDPGNDDSGWQGAFRTGPLDLLLLRYACALTDPTVLAVTCLDRVEFPAQVSASYAYHGDLPDLEPYFDEVAGEVKRIVPDQTDRMSLARAEAVANRLKRCRPILEEAADAGVLAGMIETTVGAPVLIGSWGAEPGRTIDARGNGRESRWEGLWRAPDAAEGASRA